MAAARCTCSDCSPAAAFPAHGSAHVAKQMCRAMLRHVAWPYKGFGGLPVEAGEALRAGDCCTRIRTKSGPCSGRFEQWRGSRSSLAPSKAMLTSAVQQAPFGHMRRDSEMHCVPALNSGRPHRWTAARGTLQCLRALTKTCEPETSAAMTDSSRSKWSSRHSQNSEDLSPTGRSVSWAGADLPA